MGKVESTARRVRREKGRVLEIRVREAKTADAEDIYTLSRELAASVGDEPPEREAVLGSLKALLEASHAHVLVAEDEEGVAGVVSLWIKPDLAHGDTVVEVPMLAVVEDRRREGVGKLLMRETRKQAYEHGASLIELIATYDNVVARDFYRSLGFVETDHVSLEFMGDLEDPPEPDEE